MQQPKKTPRFAILASGRGSNAAALMDGFTNGSIPGSVAVVITNNQGAPVLAKSAARDCLAECIPSQGLSREAHEKKLLARLTELNVDHVLLAGYMRILSADFINAFAGSILNIHPSLLPEFRGMNPVQKQWDAGVEVAGATVHLVTPEVDSGPIVLQASLAVEGIGSAEELADRILTEIEHVIYPQAVKRFVEGLDALPKQEDLS